MSTMDLTDNSKVIEQDNQLERRAFHVILIALLLILIESLGANARTDDIVIKDRAPSPYSATFATKL